MRDYHLTIVLAPLIAAIIAGLFGRQIGRAAAHWITILGVGLSFVISTLVLKDIYWDGGPIENYTVYTCSGYSNTEALGAVLYTEHVYAFEIAAVILLLAIVAAITLTMRKRPGLKQQNIAEQVAVRASDRIRIVKMDAERRE